MLDENAKRELLRKIPHALYACGVHFKDELNVFTASWVTQGSFKPPVIVMGVRAESGSSEMIRETGVFALSFLESGQQDLAQRFFQPARRAGNKLNDVAFYLGKTGCPIIQDSLGFVECEVTGHIEAGDHTVFVGQVVAAGLHREGRILELKETKWHYGG